jgi:hypothetical protein
VLKNGDTWDFGKWLIISIKKKKRERKKKDRRLSYRKPLYRRGRSVIGASHERDIYHLDILLEGFWKLIVIAMQ